MKRDTSICSGCGEYKYKCWCDVDCVYCNKKLYKCSGDSEDGVCPIKKRIDKIICFS